MSSNPGQMNATLAIDIDDERVKGISNGNGVIVLAGEL